MTMRRFVAVPTLLLAVTVVWSVVAVSLVSGIMQPGPEPITLSESTPGEPIQRFQSIPASLGETVRRLDLSND